MELAVPLDIAVNFTDQKSCRLKLRKSGKKAEVLMYYFVPLKDCST